MPTTSRCFAPVRGKAMRITKVDGCGSPIYGDDSSVVSDGFVSISVTSNTDEGDEISVTNAAGATCVKDTPCPQFLNFGIEIEFCNVDPYLFALLTGQEPIADPATGDVIGFSVCSTADACAQGFALEVWTGTAGAKCTAGQSLPTIGYMLFPFLQGGTFGDFTIENDAISFTVTGAITKDGSTWGSGPFGVQTDADGNAVPLTSPVTDCDHLKFLAVTQPAPTPYCGPIPALDPAGAPVTGAAVEAGSDESGNGLMVDPAPAGDDPYWVDYGDGSWDYSDGSEPLEEHVYSSPGKYTVTVNRGSSSYQVDVVVPYEGPLPS